MHHHNQHGKPAQGGMPGYGPAGPHYPGGRPPHGPHGGAQYGEPPGGAQYGGPPGGAPYGGMQNQMTGGGMHPNMGGGMPQYGGGMPMQHQPSGPPNMGGGFHHQPSGPPNMGGGFHHQPSGPPNMGGGMQHQPSGPPNMGGGMQHQPSGSPAPTSPAKPSNMGGGAGKGGIQVTIVRGSQMPKKTDFIGKSDPYLKISCAGDVQQTTVKKNAGASAEWQETFFFGKMSNALEFELWDKDRIGKDDKLAVGTLPITQKSPGQSWKGVVELEPTKKKWARPVIELLYTVQ